MQQYAYRVTATLWIWGTCSLLLPFPDSKFTSAGKALLEFVIPATARGRLHLLLSNGLLCSSPLSQPPSQRRCVRICGCKWQISGDTFLLPTHIQPIGSTFSHANDTAFRERRGRSSFGNGGCWLQQRRGKGWEKNYEDAHPLECKTERQMWLASILWTCLWCSEGKLSWCSVLHVFRDSKSSEKVLLLHRILM